MRAHQGGVDKIMVKARRFSYFEKAI